MISTALSVMCGCAHTFICAGKCVLPATDCGIGWLRAAGGLCLHPSWAEFTVQRDSEGRQVCKADRENNASNASPQLLTEIYVKITM